MNNTSIATRRELLHRGLTMVGAASTVPAFLQRTALAVAPEEGAMLRSRPGVPDERVLVIVQMAGGNDGLNTVVPFANDLYYEHRPRLAIDRNDVLKINDRYGFHPVMSGFRELYDDGLLSVVEGVGYPNPNRSHFKSMDVWHTASPDGREHTGWIGRYFDNACGGEDACDPKTGVAVMKEAPLAMRGKAYQPVAFQRPDALSWNGAQAIKGRGRNRRQMRSGAPTEEVFASLNEPMADHEAMDEVDFLRRTAMDARLSAADIQKAARMNSNAEYPGNPLAGALQTVARMIHAEMPTRIYYVSQGGYDTHSGQLNRHQQLLTQFSGAVKSFVDDLNASGHLDRVTIMTFSEFGRRVSENASAGTDHGEAAPMFVIGKHIQPGFHGKACSLEHDKLHRGDLAWTTDFRRVYGSVLKDWMGADVPAILGKNVDSLKLFAKV